MSLPPEEQEQPRAYHLQFKDHDDYLRVEIGGQTDSLETSMAYWRAIAAECERRKAHSLLAIDSFGGEPLPPQDMDAVIAALSDSYLLGMRVAYCKLNSAYLPEAEYGELSARELGYTVRVFADEREAELWLRYGAD